MRSSAAAPRTLAAGRPIVALARQGGAIRELLDEVGARYAAAAPGDPAAIRDVLLGLAAPASAAEAEPAAFARLRYDRLVLDLERELRLAAVGREAKPAAAAIPHRAPALP
jgi:hypothetical protein